MQTVSPIRPEIVFGEGKQTFLDTIAEAYDLFAEDLNGEVPVACLFAFVGASGSTRNGWHVLSEAEPQTSLYVARGLFCLQADALEYDREPAS